MSWWPSFNFSLPSLSPPLSIQRRFIAFVLKRLLGHLLKPGQLDVQQIDAQIGNGFVEIKNLELDASAISTLLKDIPCRLVEGSIGSVTIRIPWPNPFTATIGLSISDLDLTLALSECDPPYDAESLSNDLAASVASVADTFIHNELTDGEETMLRQSVHWNSARTGAPPGSLDPFIDADDGPEASSTGGATSDPEGISIFAGLFEGLLARFEFTAVNVCVRLLHESNARFDLHTSRIEYFTALEGDTGNNASTGERRTLQIFGLKLSTEDLSPVRDQYRDATPPQPSVSASDNSDSEIDDETQMMMSQSLVSLPPQMGMSLRPPPLSPSLSTISSASVESSMYQSALSDSRHVSRPSSPSTVLKEENPEGKNEVLLLIPDSISITLTTPRPYTSNADVPSSNHPIHDAGIDTLQLDITLELVILTIRAHHLKSILKAVDAFPKSQSTPSNPKPAASNSLLDRLVLSASLKGLVAIAFDCDNEQSIEPKSLETFYAHPLVPPKLNTGYLRLHVDSSHFKTFNAASTSFGDVGHNKEALCTVSDFSLIAFHAPGSSSDQSHPSSPILVTDQYLSQSYSHNHRPSEHIHPGTEEDKSRSLPSFEVIDWTSEKGRTHGASLRPWRTKRPAHVARSRLSGQGVSTGYVSGVGLSTSPGSPRTVGFDVPSSPPRSSAQHAEHSTTHPALTIDVLRGGADLSSRSVNVETNPLHLFLDLPLLSSVLVFADAAKPVQGSDIQRLRSDNSTHHATSETRKSAFMSDLTKRELDDLALSMDYSEVGSSSFSHGNALVDSPIQSLVRVPDSSKKRAQVQLNNGLNIDLRVPLFRLEVRAPPAASHSCRTGSFVIDLHEVRFHSDGLQSLSKPLAPRHVEFERKEEEDWYTDWLSREAKSVRVGRIICAYAGYAESKAKAFLSIGPDDVGSNGTSFPMLLVSSSHLSSSRTTIREAQAPGSPATVMLRIPSVHVDLHKDILDGLQLWADDVTQWSAKLGASQGSQPSTTNNSAGASRNPSLIGSRYFAKRSESGATESDMSNQAASENSEIVLKIAVVKGFVRLNMPIDSVDKPVSRVLDLTVSGVDTLVEVKPQGKDETVVTLGVSDVHVEESASNTTNELIQTRISDTRHAQRAAVTLRFHAINVPQTSAKESKIRLALHGVIINVAPDFDLLKNVTAFVKAPPGAFESVVPSERTRLSVTVSESSMRVIPTVGSGALILSLSDVGFSTDLVGNSSNLTFGVFGGGTNVLLTDDCETLSKAEDIRYRVFSDAEYWTTLGYAMLANIEDFKVDVEIENSLEPVDIRVNVDGLDLDIHLCADTISGIARFATDMQSAFSPTNDEDIGRDTKTTESRPAPVTSASTSTSVSVPTNLLNSLDEEAFKKIPEIGPIPDMIGDDLPSNPEYLDSSFGAAAGLRPLDDDEMDEFSPNEIISDDYVPKAGLSRFGGETIKMLQPSIDIMEDFYDTLPPGALVSTPDYGETSTRVRLQRVNCRLLLYDGYDWEKTRTAIQEEIKRVKRRLAKIRQLLASGQTYDPTVDEVNTLLFNSVYVGLDQEAEELEAGALIAKIDEELLDDQTDTRSESSWQSFKPDLPSPKARPQGFVARSRKLTRSRGPSVEFSLQGFDAEFDQYRSKVPLVSRLLFMVRDVEILDHMKTSTWSTFLTQLRSDSRGNIREADSNMVRVELQMILPNAGHTNEEARLKAKLLPLRLHVDQDALDFLKKFFSFSDSSAPPSPPPKDEIYFQHAEVFPVDIKLDYKPRRVDYRALREGKTIELMNFFHFDGAEMTLRHITLKGITGWPRFFDSLNDLWTPDVKANQLVDVISGVSPIRSAVNVGSGIADLVLLPIAQYKKDGRVIRGLQKGTKAFVKSTAMEAIKLGAQLATGTQVVLEQAENFLGVKGEVTAETLQFPSGMPVPADVMSDNDDSDSDFISRYAEQPKNIREGVQSASKAIAKNLKVAGQTILAVPMEVYERSGTEGPARAVIRAVPIAVLKPMIGASEAVSKTLLGLRNTLDPSIPIDSEVKYKHR